MTLGAARRVVNKGVAAFPALTANGRVLASRGESLTVPSIVVTLPAPFHRSAGGVGELEVEGETVAGALADLRARRPALARRFLDERNVPRPGVSLFLNGGDLAALAGLATPVAAGDRLAVLLLLSGG